MDLATLAGQDADCCNPLTAAPIAHEDAASSRASSRRSPIPRVRLLTLCDITEPVGLSQPTVSHHLKILVEAGLLAREQRGTWAFYSIVPGALGHLSDVLRDPTACDTQGLVKA